MSDAPDPEAALERIAADLAPLHLTGFTVPPGGPVEQAEPATLAPEHSGHPELDKNAGADVTMGTATAPLEPGRWAVSLPASASHARVFGDAGHGTFALEPGGDPCVINLEGGEVGERHLLQIDRDGFRVEPATSEPKPADPGRHAFLTKK
jgi:hypothetical protein